MRKLDFVVLAIISLLHSVVQGQEPTSLDTLIALEHFHKADSTYQNPALCLELSQKAIPFIKKAQLWENYILTLNGISYCHQNLGNIEAYEASVDKALSEAKQYLSPSNKVRYFSNWNKAVFLTDVKGMYKEGIRIYQERPENLQLEIKILEGKVNNNIGVAYQKLGDFNAAIPYLKLALNIYQEQNVAVFEQYKTTYNLAECYQSANQAQKAIDYFLSAEKLLRKTKNYAKKKLTINLVLAKAYLLNNQMDSTEYYLQKANKITRKTATQTAAFFRMKGQLFQKQEQYPKAVSAFQEALANFPATNPIIIAETYYDLAENCRATNELKRAFNANTKGIRLLTNSFDKEGLPKENSIIHSEHLLLKLIAQKAAIHASQDELTKAVISYQYAYQLQQKYQGQLFDQSSKLFRNEEQVDFHEASILVAWRLYEKTKEEAYIDLAFQFAESSKASVLLEEIKKKEAEDFSNLPDSLRDLRYELLSEIKFTAKRLKESSSSSLQDTLSKKQLASKEKLAALERQLKKEYPVYNQLVNKSVIIPLDDVQKSLSPTTAFIEYFLTDKAVFAFYIDASNKKMLKENLEKPLGQDLLDFLHEKKALSPKNYKTLGYRLYQKLILPLKIPEGIQKLTIVPHSSLALLPFAMLPTSDKGNKFRTLDYLLRDYITKYAYSATTLAAMEKQSQQPTKNWLGVAPVFEGARLLWYSKEEVAASAKLFRGDQLLHAAATKTAFLLQAPKYRYLHISTHAQALGTEEPAIYFHKDTLHLSELYTLRLHSELVFLSACETQLGAQDKAEGVLSLSRGFTYAGVPSLIATLWQANDKTTSEIVQNFYKNLKKGLPKDEALHQAQLHYLENSTTVSSPPYYWAAFTLTGAAGNGEVASFGYVFWLVLGLLVGGAGKFFLYSIRRTNNGEVN